MPQMSQQGSRDQKQDRRYGSSASRNITREGGRGTSNSSDHKSVSRGHPPRLSPISTQMTSKSSATHAASSGSKMQLLNNPQKANQPAGQGDAPTNPSPSSGSAKSWAALLGGAAAPKAQPTPSVQEPQAAPAPAAEEKKAAESAKESPKTSPAAAPKPAATAASQPASPAKASASPSSAPLQPLRPAPWAKIAAGSPSSQPAAAPKAAAPAPPAAVATAPAPSTLTTTSAAGAPSPSPKGASTPTSPRTFTFNRGNGVAIVHEVPDVEHHLHPPQPAQKPANDTEVSAPPKIETKEAEPAVAPVLSWAEKAKLIASSAPPSKKPVHVAVFHNTPPVTPTKRGGGGGSGGRQKGGPFSPRSSSGGRNQQQHHQRPLHHQQQQRDNHASPHKQPPNVKQPATVSPKSAPRPPVESTSSREPTSPLSQRPSSTLSMTSSASSIPPLEQAPPPTVDAPSTSAGAGTPVVDFVMPSHEALDALCDAMAACRLPDGVVANERVLPRGIKNPGNLCFVNAVLQSLMGSSSFCRLALALQSAQPHIPQRAYPVLAAMAAIAVEFQKSPPPDAASSSTKSNDAKNSFKLPTGKDAAAAAAETSQKKNKDAVVTVLGGHPVASSLVMELIHRFSPRQQNRAEGQVEQEDAHEFLHFLLDKMHNELLALKKRLKPDGGNDAAEEGATADDVDEDGWLVKSGKRAVRQQEVSAAPTEEASLITTLFEGKFATSVACAGAPNSVTVHPFQIVEVPIYSDTIRSIDDALDALTAPEHLEDYKPSSGAPPQHAAKTERFLQLPEILVLHLMRFQFTGKSAKISKVVAFEPRLAMRSSWMAPNSSDRGAVYDLVATVIHHGKSISSGHYTADVLQPDGKWLRFDDAGVYGISQQQVLQDRPYLLIYQRQKRS